MFDNTYTRTGIMSVIEQFLCSGGVFNLGVFNLGAKKIIIIIIPISFGA